MKILLFTISMLLPAMAGYTLFRGEAALSRLERLIFSYTVGTGLLSFYLFGLMLLGLPFTVLTVSPFFLLFLVIALFERGGSGKRSAPSSGVSLPLEGISWGRKVLFLFLAALIIWKVAFIVFLIFSAPTRYWDAYTLWNFKAKVIYYASGAGTGHAFEKVLRGEYRNYPLNLQLMRAWIATFLGEWNEGLVNLHSLLLFLCLIGLTYELLKKTAGRLTAMVFTYALSAVPLLVYNTLSGYADMAVGYYFLAGTIMLYYWHKTGSNRFLVYCGVIASVAMFTKNEGTAMVFPALVLTFLLSVFFSGRSWKFIAGSTVLFLLSSVLVLLWIDKSGALSAIWTISGMKGARVAFHPEGVMPILGQLFIFRSHNIFWFGAALLILLNWKKALGSDARFFLIPSVLSLGATLFIFLFTPNVSWLMNGTTINRTMLITVPVLTVALGFLMVPRKSDIPGVTAGGGRGE